MRRQPKFRSVVVILSLCSILLNGVSCKAAETEQTQRQGQHRQEGDGCAGDHRHHQHGDGPDDSHSHEHSPRGRRSADGGRAEADEGEEAQGKSIRRHPVHLYKGAEPWRPLSNSVPFGVGAVELPPAASIDEEEQELTGSREAQPLASVDAPSDNVPVKVPGILNGVASINASDQLTESVALEYTEGGPRRSKSALHESLRRPLRRLTDRQLALLLKQVRKQRRGQFGQRENNEEGPISTRQEMLDQLKTLLKQPQEGQRLIRPKLLTNVNILPNEWNIYPAPRNIGAKNGSDRDQKLDKGQQKHQETADEDRSTDQQKVSVQTIEIGADNQRGEVSSSASSSTPTQFPTTSADSILTQPQFELKATIRPPIVQSVVLVPDQKATEKTEKEETKVKMETEQNHQQNKEEEEKRAAKMEANWQTEEQKLMAEMRTAVQKADSAMEKLESQRRKESAQSDDQPTAAKLASKTLDHDLSEIKVLNVSQFAEQERSELGELSTALREIRSRYETVKHEFQKKMKRMGLAHRFKTPSQFKAAGTTTFIEEEAQNGTNTEFGLDLDNNKTATNAEGGNATNGGKATDETTEEKKASTAQEEEHTTAVPIPNGQRNRRPTDGKENNTNKNETTAEEENTLNVGKAKSKLTLAELAEELEQIERTIATGKGKAGLKELEIESGTLQKAKKILQKDKKAKQKNRARVSSSFSPQPKGEGTPKALANGGGNLQSVAINKIVEKIKKATALKEGHQQHKKAEKPQKGHKSHGNISENAVKGEDQQQQAVQPVPNNVQQQHQTTTARQTMTVKITAKGKIGTNQLTSTAELNKLKTVLVDTSTTEHEAQHQQKQQQQQQQQQQQHRQEQTHHQHGNNQNGNIHQFNQQQFNPSAAAEHFYHPQQQQLHAVQQQQHLQIQPQQQQQLAQSQHFIHQQQQQIPKPQQDSYPPQHHRHEQQQQQLQFDHAQQPHQQQKHVPAQHPQQLHQLQRHGQSQRPNSAGGGFYQLERAQVANVSQKTAKPSSSSELKLKGVAQLEVGKGNDQQQQRGPGEISNSQLSDRLRKEWQRKNGTKKEQPKEDEDLANLEEFARIDEQAICDAIACNFETGALCEWESSVDELNPSDPRYRRYMMARTMLLARHRRRSKRNRDEVEPKEEEKAEGEDEMTEFGQNLLLTDNEEEEGHTTTAKTKQKKTDQRTEEQPPQGGRTVLRSWHNWVGRYRNRLTGISQSEVFSTRNQRFAASYLKPGQRSTLTGRLLSGDRATVRFKAWEATRSLQLRVCCDRTDREENCVFATELGVKRSSRKWTDHLATCPQGTKKIIFECRNQGPFQGACGVDNIQLVNAYCPSVTPMKANRKL
ncbi:hypothetical protein niasHT_021388 [Heterodera trifolii]|uniref:Uncharacterized protein n=1 Tax=Heterodera trifolii TaxID=157864 RepID=A0ABD2K7I0_9BILA